MNRMRVLWVCSFAPGVVSDKLGEKRSAFGGWIDGALERIANDSNVRIGICFPQNVYKRILTGQIGNIDYYGFYCQSIYSNIQKMTTQHCKEILEAYMPDVVHIWGAEFPYSIGFCKAINREKVVCSIQGLCSIYMKHFYANLPINTIHRKTFRDLVRRDSITKQRSKYERRGETEKQILSSVGHTIGRTNWDKACANMLAPNAMYHHCNETLRGIFYEKTNAWSYNLCEKHSIFISQSNYPIKGFHILLEAISIIINKYPDLKVYTTGSNPCNTSWYRISGYAKYIKGLIIRNNLSSKINFLGTLDANHMCDMYLKANVFVSASSIENSPNSVGEAMLLGVPIIASYVGGTMDMLKDKEEGLLYQFDAPYMLAYYIDQIFSMESKAKEYGNNASKHAYMTHNPQKNYDELVDIYKEVSEQ